jgi:hypothetical protein
MARQESDREDFLREATALVERIELAPAAGDGEHVVVGFRRDGAASIYFGVDPAYHFNVAGELRRAYCDGLLIKAERGRLISLERVRQENEVQLLRREMPAEAEQKFLAEMIDRIRTLVLQLREQQLISVGQMPADADVLGRAIAWLSNCKDIAVAASPRVG